MRSVLLCSGMHRQKALVRSRPSFSSLQTKHDKQNLSHPGVLQHLQAAFFLLPHILPLFCPRLSQINISLARLSSHPPSINSPLLNCVLPSHFTLFHAVFLSLPCLSVTGPWPAPPHPLYISASVLCVFFCLNLQQKLWRMGEVGYGWGRKSGAEMGSVGEGRLVGWLAAWVK